MLLCAALLFGWMAISPKLFPRPAPPPGKPAPTAPAEPPAAARQQQPPAQPAAIAPATAPPSATEPPVELQENTLGNSRVTLQLSNEGATVTSAHLNQYFEDTSSKQPLKLLTPFATGHRSLAMQVEGIDLTGQRFKVVSADKRRVQYQTTLPTGLVLTKTIELPPDSYHAVVTVSLSNGTEQPVQAGYWITSAAGIMPELAPWQKNDGKTLKQETFRDVQGAIGARLTNGSDKIIRKAPGKVQEKPEVYRDATVTWVSVVNQYFSAVLVPREKGFVIGGKLSAVGTNNIAGSLETAREAIQPGQSVEHSFMFFVGPNSDEVKTNPDYAVFANLHSLAWPAPISGFFLWILRTFYGFVRNYGVAIMLLTLVVRVALHPLSRKSQKSMGHMQKLGPRMKELQAKYKEDKKKLQEETMKLYREHGVNPMSGCLPLILQLPILIGLYGALRSDIAMRHAPFLLWIKDLSQPDALMMLPASIPWAVTLNVLPILMIVGMIVQQLITPKPTDPQSEQSQKMMMWMMPAMFFFMFYHMPSGLVLYFLTSTGLGILESNLIRKHMGKLELAPAKPKSKKKQTWLERAAKARAAKLRR